MPATPHYYSLLKKEKLLNFLQTQPMLTDAETWSIYGWCDWMLHPASHLPVNIDINVKDQNDIFFQKFTQTNFRRNYKWNEMKWDVNTWMITDQLFPSKYKLEFLRLCKGCPKTSTNKKSVCESAYEKEF